MRIQRYLSLPFIGVGLASFLFVGCTQQREFAEPQANGQERQTTEETQTQTNTRSPDVIYVPTPQPVVDAMLQLANTNSNDVVYDLGSGDGRIPITAAQKYNARAVGIEIDPERIREAKRNAKSAGVSDSLREAWIGRKPPNTERRDSSASRVEFKQQDLFQSDFSDATVVTLYLLSSLNEKLRPKLLQELKPGTRIVSHAFAMGDWKPEKTMQVEGKTIHLWVVPENRK